LNSDVRSEKSAATMAGPSITLVIYCFAYVFLVIVDLTDGTERLSEETRGGVKEHHIKPYKSRTAVKDSIVL